MSDNEVKTVNCPNCKDEVQWIESNNHRPFCSERCKLIDFGEWATEKHAIAGDPVFPPEDNSDENLQ